LIPYLRTAHKATSVGRGNALKKKVVGRMGK
jgi:hypothetical protein